MEHGLKDIALYVQKHITPCTVVITSLLVRDKPIEAPTSVKRVLMQVKWGMEVLGRDLYLLKANLAPPTRNKHLKRAEEVIMTRLHMGHCKATKGHIVSCGPPAVCHHCSSTLSRKQKTTWIWHSPITPFYEADSLTVFFECIRPLAIIEYLKEAVFFHLIWQVYEIEITNVKSHKPKKSRLLHNWLWHMNCREYLQNVQDS